MFSCAQMWLFNIPIPTFISILFTTRVNGYIFFLKKTHLEFCSVRMYDNHAQKKNFENSLRSPSSFQKNVLICHKSVLLKSELHTCQTGILLSIDCLFFFEQDDRTIDKFRSAWSYSCHRQSEMFLSQ